MAKIILMLVGQVDVHLRMIPYAPLPALTPQGGEGREENMSKRERQFWGPLIPAEYLTCPLFQNDYKHIEYNILLSIGRQWDTTLKESKGKRKCRER